MNRIAVFGPQPEALASFKKKRGPIMAWRKHKVGTTARNCCEWEFRLKNWRLTLICKSVVFDVNGDDSAEQRGRWIVNEMYIFVNVSVWPALVKICWALVTCFFCCFVHSSRRSKRTNFSWKPPTEFDSIANYYAVKPPDFGSWHSDDCAISNN